MSDKKVTKFEFKDGKVIRGSAEQDKPVTDEGSSEFDNRLMLENYRERRATKTARKKVGAVILIFFAACAALSLLVFLIFRVDNVTISGSEKYTPEELSSAIGFSRYENLFFVNKSKIAQQLYDKFPTLDSIDVGIVLPSTLKITVKDGVGRYYVKFDGEYCILTESLHVMDIESESPSDMRELICSDIKSMVLGNDAEFSHFTTYNYLTGLLKDISGHEINGNIVCIDMSEKFDVKLIYSDRFIIKIGRADDVPTKLTLAMEYIETLTPEEKGIIDASDLQSGSFLHLDSITGQ